MAMIDAHTREIAPRAAAPADGTNTILCSQKKIIITGRHSVVRTQSLVGGDSLNTRPLHGIGVLPRLRALLPLFHLAFVARVISPLSFIKSRSQCRAHAGSTIRIVAIKTTQWLCREAMRTASMLDKLPTLYPFGARTLGLGGYQFWMSRTIRLAYRFCARLAICLPLRKFCRGLYFHTARTLLFGYNNFGQDVNLHRQGLLLARLRSAFPRRPEPLCILA